MTLERHFMKKVGSLCGELFYSGLDEEDKKVVKEGLAEILPLFYFFRGRNPLSPEDDFSMNYSSGASGGTYNIDLYNIKEYDDPELLQRAVETNRLVRNRHPELAVASEHVIPREFVLGTESEQDLPGVDIDEVLSGLDEDLGYLVCEEFFGTRLDHPKYEAFVEVPFEVIEQHLRNSIRLETIDLVSHFGEEIYEKEDYRGKFEENLDSLETIVDLSSESRELVIDAISEYRDNAIKPFWDRNIQNAKYDEEEYDKTGKIVIKNFDWNKAVCTLVIPVYEAVQIAHSYGKRIDEMKETAREEYISLEPRGFAMDEFDRFWDMGTLYFLTRRLHYSINDDDEQGMDKFLKLLGEHNFSMRSGEAIAADVSRFL